MGRLIKFVLYLVCLGFLGLVAYTYIGPYVGADFSPPLETITEPVILNAD